MAAPRVIIDTSFDVRSDARGKDPDVASATLRRYHQTLWSKPLPNGAMFSLDATRRGAYLYHASDENEQFLSSDSIIHTYRDHITSTELQIHSEDLDSLLTPACTISGYTLFPGIRRTGTMTINQARGTHPRIRDRIDLTLECIRRHYEGESSPLAKTLANYRDFFDLFEDFPRYVDFFFLSDLVGRGDGSIRFMLPADGFESRDPRPHTESEYLRYREAAMEFLAARRQRIEAWISERD